MVAIYNERGDRRPGAGITETVAETMPETEQQQHPAHSHPELKPDPQPVPELEHFTDNRPNRVQNFSFASSYPYAPGRVSSSSNSNTNYSSTNYNAGGFNVQRYQSPYNFQHVVTNAFSVLRHQPSEEPEFDSYPTRPQQAIVRPIRREAGIADNRDNHVAEPAGNPPQRSHFSRSNQEVRSFADELSQKLRFLAPEEQNYGGRQSANSGAWLDPAMSQRPRFETTVPQGIFLPPPHEVQMIPATMLRRHVYAYSSYPMILQGYLTKETGSESKEQKVTATRLNGLRATAAVAAATAAASKSSRNDTQSLAGGLHITKAQFQQQLQQRRSTSNNNNNNSSNISDKR